jgi:tetratricopeptide (TPR) repeat protein
MAQKSSKTKRYAAFLSYSHCDERWAKWLQRALERYRIPKRITRQRIGAGQADRLYPVFRDRDELVPSTDLSEAIQTAIDQSDAMIVVCSPSAAASNWVNEEIRYFLQGDRSKRLFCLLVEGSTHPGSTDCALPRSLLHTDDGLALPETAAADPRPHADGKRGAMLKIAAGMLDTRLDNLVQRDTQRQIRVRSTIAAGSLVISIVTIGLAITAQLAREEAVVRRSQAENLISFMLGDLRSKLESVGRLDLLDAVGDEAMDYFGMLDGGDTKQDVLARARAQRQIGEVRFRQGRLEPARTAFEESRDTARGLYDSETANDEYLYELGQAEFWVGYVALEQSRLDQTRKSFLLYMQYSQELLARAPDNVNYQTELMYAYSNLGTMSLEFSEPAAALEYFEQSNRINESLVAADPEDPELKYELANGYSWLGATLLSLNRLKGSKAAYRTAVDELKALHLSGGDMVYSEEYGENLRLLANVHTQQGENSEAETLLKDAREVFETLVKHDPENAIWRGDRGICAYNQAELLQLLGQTVAARKHLDQATSDLTRLVDADSGDSRDVEYLALTERLLALQALDRDEIRQALVLNNRAFQRMLKVIGGVTFKPRAALTFGAVAETQGRIQSLAGDAAEAVATWGSALDFLLKQPERSLAQLAVERRLAIHLRRDDVAAERIKRLAETDFADRRFL